MKIYLSYLLLSLSLIFFLAACSKKKDTKPDDNPFLSGSNNSADLVLSNGEKVKLVGGVDLMGMLGNYMIQDDDNPDLYNVVISFSDGDMIQDKDPKYSIGINLFEIPKAAGTYILDPEDEDMSQKPMFTLTDMNVAGYEDSTAIYYPVLFDGEHQTIRMGESKVEVTSFKGTKIKGTFSGTVFNLYGGDVDSIIIKNGKFEVKLNDMSPD